MIPARLRRGRLALARAVSAVLVVSLAGLAACASRTPSGAAQAPRPPESTDVFVGGEGGYAVYRIPALLATTRGTVLAFAEGRANLSDNARNDLVLRASADGGRTFGALRVVARADGGCLNNPCVVEIEQGVHHGRILLVFQRYPDGVGEARVVPGYDDPRVCRTFLAWSDDDGASWSAPRDITREAKRPEVTSVASGPGRGIQLRAGPRAGRIVVPFNQGPADRWRVYALYSDDGGDTWTRGECAPDPEKGVANEVQVAEAPDGRILLNARSFHGAKQRLVAWSGDQGATWSRLVYETELPDPSCMASLVASGGALGPGFLYAGPGGESGRTDGTLRLSADGESWTGSWPIAAGPFAYSGLAFLPDARLGCLYEADGYARIRLARLDLPGLESP